MDDIRKKLLSYLKKHDEVVEKAGPHWGPDTSSSPSEMAETGRRFTSAEPQTSKRKEPQPRSQASPASAPSASSGSPTPSRPSDSPWRKLPEGQERKYTTVETPGPYGPTSPGSKKSKVEVVNTPGYLQSKYGSGDSMHPGGGAYTSKQLRTLVKDFLREYDI